MWPNPQFPADLITFTVKSLMENFIFCAVKVSFSLPLETSRIEREHWPEID